MRRRRARELRPRHGGVITTIWALNRHGNIFSGCGRGNSDDGFDVINSPGACTVEHSGAVRNGYQPEPHGRGNGAGSSRGFVTIHLFRSDPASRHSVQRGVGHRAQGCRPTTTPAAIDGGTKRRSTTTQFDISRCRRGRPLLRITSPRERAPRSPDQSAKSTRSTTRGA